ncbi:hypothetical protein MYX64_01415 [Nitrospinae bacterium AH_259_B05_G02_I21]|nr:hypothetical protein [Nitrospinae bacterium AH_259_B05_G02_I21]
MSSFIRSSASAATAPPAGLVRVPPEGQPPIGLLHFTKRELFFQLEKLAGLVQARVVGFDAIECHEILE